MAQRKYYTLLTRDGGTGSPWAPQFGDYDRDVVIDEQTDTYSATYRSRDMKIIRTADDQPSIDAAIAKLNGSN